MARDGLFFSRLARVHPRFGTPAFAIGASALWALVLATTGTFEQLLTYVVFTGWIFYALGAMSIFVYRRRPRPQHHRRAAPPRPRRHRHRPARRAGVSVLAQRRPFWRCSRNVVVLERRRFCNV